MLTKILKWAGVFLGLGVLAGFALLGLIFYISFDLPQINSLADYNPPVPSRILSKDGEVLMETGKEKREITTLEETPQRIIDAFLAAEDDNFYSHTGIDYLGILRATLINLKAGRVVQGASTITQQVAKSLLLTSERTLSRKIKDLLLAKRIEDKFTKNEILYLYLNQVYLGGGYYGIKAAVHGYFGKELSEASIAESALVAGLLVAPGKYSPYVNPQHAKTRQKYVLGRMFKTGKISRAEYDAALAENIKLMLRKNYEAKAGYFTDWIRQKIINEVGNDEFLSNGFEVVTTLDWKLQQIAEKSVKNGVEEIDKRQGFVGPIGTIDSADDLYTKNVEFRKMLYKDRSTYFIFYNDANIEYEKELLEDELSNFLPEDGHKDDELSANYVSGQKLEDPLLEHLKLGEIHQGVVLKVNDQQRVVFVDVGGTRGIIPESGFSWAHPRKISEESSYHAPVTKPSTILKKGDVVYLKLTENARNIWPLLHTLFTTKKPLPAFSDKLKTQKYLVWSLEQEPKVQGALLSINPLNGEIISMVGGSDFNKSQFNRAVQSNRQPGSSFKPFIFALGLENGYTPASILLDSPQALSAGADEELNWKPRNYDGEFRGPMTFRKALEDSRNIPTIRLAQDLGVNGLIDYTTRIGMDAKMPKDLSISLGSFGITLMELVRSFAIFPNGGKRVAVKSIISIKDRFGVEYELTDEKNAAFIVKTDMPRIPENEAEKADETKDDKTKIPPFLANLNSVQVYDPRLAYIMTNLLKGVITSGTGAGARSVSSNIAGKTGTTSSYVDAWFIGFSPNVVTGVWNGFDDNTTLGVGESGGRSALPVWREFMTHAIKKYGDIDFHVPEGIVNVTINKETGKLAGPNDKNTLLESFAIGTEPGAERDREDESGKDLSDTLLEDEGYFTAQ